ncbi:MAG: substrate-binding domain-containing protein [Lentisphaeria bacterium]|nr:substrate-binding domain-containing protein [Lentisphaeria bacterium]
MSNWKEEIAATLKGEAARLPPNSRFYPIRKLMSRFNTSQRTIEQVMEKLIAENVMVRRPGDGYFTRNQSPQRLLHYRLLYPKWPSESFKRFEMNWRNYAARSGEFRFSSRTLDRTDEFFRAFPADDCDALLIMPPAGPISRDGLRYLCSLPLPVVIMNHEVADIGLSMVSGNAAAGGAIAAAHLINHGHRRLAMLITEPHGDGLDMRCQGFTDFARLNGVSVEVLDTHTENWSSVPHSAYDCLSAHLREKGLNFSGMFIISAAKALEIYKAFNDCGISIPDDVSLVAHDELSSNEFMNPPLDSIEMDHAGVIERVHSELRRVLAGEQPFFHFRPGQKLVERQSVRSIAVK